MMTILLLCQSVRTQTTLRTEKSTSLKGFAQTGLGLASVMSLSVTVYLEGRAETATCPDGDVLSLTARRVEGGEGFFCIFGTDLYSVI